jgi:hypothetical protein
MQRVPIQFRDFAHMESFFHASKGSPHGAFVLVLGLDKLLNLAGEQAADGGGTLGGQNARLLNRLPAQAQGDVLFFVERGHGMRISSLRGIRVARFARELQDGGET